MKQAEHVEHRTGHGEGGGDAQGESTPARWSRALVHEVRTHPFGYGVMAVALVAGPCLIAMIFPQVSWVQAIVGGVAFGVYAALCAVPQKFM